MLDVWAQPVDIFEGTMVRCKQSLRESRRRYQSGRARDRNRNRNREQSPGRSMSGECRGDTSDVPGKMHVLERWRRPKYVSDSSAARPEISVEKRQAAAPCVRVGSRVSFNTVVAAILIPSARDLHAAARQELWCVSITSLVESNNQGGPCMCLLTSRGC